jgi:hypothetical protein
MNYFSIVQIWRLRKQPIKIGNLINCGFFPDKVFAKIQIRIIAVQSACYNKNSSESEYASALLPVNEIILPVKSPAVIAITIVTKMPAN